MVLFMIRSVVSENIQSQKLCAVAGRQMAELNTIRRLFSPPFTLIVILLASVSAWAQQSTTQTVQSSLAHMDRQEITRMLFHPVQVPRNTPPAGAVDIDVPVAEGVTIACRLHSHATTSPTLIFFHGNGEIITDYDAVNTGIPVRCSSWVARSAAPAPLMLRSITAKRSAA